MDKRRRVVSGVAILLGIIMVCSILAPVVTMTASAADSVSDLQQDLSNLDKQKQQLQDELNKISDDIDSTMEKKNNLDSQISITQEEIDKIASLVNELDGKIDVTAEELEEAQKEADEQYEMLSTRIRANYEQGSLSYIELLLSSQDYTQFLTNMDTVSTVVNYDQEMLDKLQELRDTIAEKKKELEEDKAAQESAKQAQESKKAELTSQMEESQALISTLESDKAATAKEMEEIAAQEAAVSAQIDKLMKEQQQSQGGSSGSSGSGSSSGSNTPQGTGSFIWPVVGYSNVTCPFGMRVHPITGVYKLHTGTDIGCPTGTTIRAMDSGTVLISGYNSAYGNYVVINHGNGVSTLYAHNSKLLVSVGQKVTKGQTIAKSGSTGYSTGPHCHFEVRVNGSYKNPMSYF